MLKIQAFYGGGVYERRTLFKGKWYDGHALQLSAVPTRAMLTDILPLLSPWRQAQARTALELRPPRPRATAERCVHGHPWAEFEMREPRRGWRFCRACKREADRRSYRENDEKRRAWLARLQAQRAGVAKRPAPPPEDLFRGWCKRGHRFTPTNTIWNPQRGRQCRVCWKFFRAKARTPLRIVREARSREA